MKMDGTDKRNVTHMEGVEWTYTSDEDRLLFISDKDTCARCYFLWETDAMGSYHRKTANIRLADSWMSIRKNGAEIIVRPQQKDGADFLILDRNGNVIQSLITGLPFASDPVFIGDGNQVAFRGGQKASKRDEGFNEAVYIINTDGSGLTQLTHYPPTDTTAEQFSYQAGPPRWNPSEKFISYQSFQHGKYSLYGVTPDGSKQWKLTDLPQDEGWHAWSPDGKWLAIEVFDTAQTEFDIALMNWETKEVKLLTDDSVKYEQAPNFVRVR